MSDPWWLSAVLRLSWPVAILVLAFLFRESIGSLIGRIHKLKATSKGVELVLHKMEKDGQLSASSRAELAGLSSHDVWALDSFEGKKIPTEVDRMNPAQRVAARTLLDLNLLTLVGEGPNRQVVVAPLGRQMLDAAKSLPLLCPAARLRLR
jgi:hypothetical protein